MVEGVPMKIIIAVATIAKALEKLKRLVPSAANQTILLKAQNNLLILSTTDMSVGGTVYCSATVEEGGKALVSFQSLLLYINNIARPKITIGTDERYCWIQTDHSRGKVVLHDMDTYTEALSSEGKGLIQAFALKASEFCSTIDDVAFAAMSEKRVSIDSREYFSCVLVKPLGQGSFDVVATDGQRMAHRVLAYDDSALTEQMLIPAMALKNFASVLDDQKDTVTCSLTPNGNVAILTCGSVTFFTRTLQGAYPLFNNSYPLDYPLCVTIDVDELITNINLATIYNAYSVYFDIGENVLIVRSAPSEEGSHIGEIPCTVEGEGVTLAFPLDYLTGVIKVIKTKKCIISCDPHGPRKTVVFTPDDNRVRFSVMPLAEKR